MTFRKRLRVAQVIFDQAEIGAYILLTLLMKWPWWSAVLLVVASACGHADRELRRQIEEMDKK